MSYLCSYWSVDKMLILIGYRNVHGRTLQVRGMYRGQTLQVRGMYRDRHYKLTLTQIRVQVYTKPVYCTSVH